ncbi:MAG: cytochrome C oxidase subunit IV family protein [Bacteroidetes bacterium]|nr:cytochrome C oxidase subunit IV family protein [Bacteroidota bacterium]
MSTHSYEEAKKVVFKGMILLGIVTLIEVFIALLGNGHLISGFELPKLIMYPLMIGLSLYKAYFIVYEFMHMRYEVKGLAMSVLLPTLLLVWAIIAFFQEGGSWGERRQQIKDYDTEQAEGVESMNHDADTKVLEGSH